MPLFCGKAIDLDKLNDISLKQLALLGDAVFHVFEREREILSSTSAGQMHRRARVSAKAQALLLAKLTPQLTEKEKDLVRRARNMKPAHYRKSEQSQYRRATAFEALIGHLYLSDRARMEELLHKTLDEPDGVEDHE